MDARIPIKLATALLLHEGEISITDIEALPFVEDRQMAYGIARHLTKRYDSYISQREINGAEGSTWEDVLVLNSPVPLPRTGGNEAKAAANPRHRKDFNRLMEEMARSSG